MSASFHQLGILARLRGDYEETERFYRQSLEIKERLGDQVRIAASFYQLGVLAQIGATTRRPSASTASPSRSMSASGNKLGMAASLLPARDVGPGSGATTRKPSASTASPSRSKSASGTGPEIAEGLPPTQGFLAQARDQCEEAERCYRQSLEIR